MSEAANILRARADELRLELASLDSDIKMSRKSIESHEQTLREGKEFLNSLVQERRNIEVLVEELLSKAEAVG